MTNPTRAEYVDAISDAIDASDRVMNLLNRDYLSPAEYEVLTEAHVCLTNATKHIRGAQTIRHYSWQEPVTRALENVERGLATKADAEILRRAVK